LDGCEASTNEFDILLWWRVNAPKYPILTEIAHDILTIPISTIASESAFSNGRYILDPFRSSLSLLTVEALICTQDWLKSNEDLLKYLMSMVNVYKFILVFIMINSF